MSLGLLYMTPTAVASATSTMVGNYLGEAQTKQVTKVCQLVFFSGEKIDLWKILERFAWKLFTEEVLLHHINDIYTFIISACCELGSPRLLSNLSFVII